jgi:hypothetical protein
MTYDPLQKLFLSTPFQVALSVESGATNCGDMGASVPTFSRSPEMHHSAFLSKRSSAPASACKVSVDRLIPKNQPFSDRIRIQEPQPVI